MINTLQLDNDEYQTQPAEARTAQARSSQARPRGNVCQTEWHRPRNRRSFALVSGYGEVLTSVSAAPHPLARRRFAGTVSIMLTGVISAAVVAGLFAIAHVRAPEPVPAQDPITTVAQIPDAPAP